MKRTLIIVSIVFVAILAAVRFYPRPELEFKKAHGYIQGTTYNITYQYDKNKDLKPEIEKTLHNFDMSLSSYNPNSIISRINNNDPSVLADDLFIEVFKKSVEINLATDGAFDITVAPIVNAMGFGAKHKVNIDTALIDSLLQFVGMDKVKLEGRRIIKENPSVTLDVDGIAQGFSVDVVCKFLDKKKVKNYLVEIGGELRSKGKNGKGQKWKVGIDRPVEGNETPGKDLQAVIELNEKALTTAGNYRKFYLKDGIKYAHTIDPKTGFSVFSRLLSVTIIADDAITADGYDTALMVMGLEKSIEFLSHHPELEAYLIYSDDQGNYKVYTTKGMKDRVVEEVK
jgi:FAD:protein FMN transferase